VVEKTAGGGVKTSKEKKKGILMYGAGGGVKLKRSRRKEVTNRGSPP